MRSRLPLRLRLVVAILGTALALLMPPTGARVVRAQVQRVAIVVHPQTPVRNLSLDDLRRVFLAEQQFWPDGTRITLLVRAPAAPERAIVLARVYRMGEEEFRQYWVGKMFRAEVPAGPQVVFSSRMARELVATIPGAITFMPADEVGPNARVLRIEGKLPGEAGYLLEE